jgi:hypothetical protein
MHRKGSVIITLDGDFNLNLEDVFPDGVPENPDAEAVVKAMEECGTIERLMGEWSLNPTMVHVTVYDEREVDDPLSGEGRSDSEWTPL